ncbi:c-type cytochrome [Prosthecobacter vanneervenii]|uniref:Mono/diheme cytochrome c family protein n=1 Tax=Prosthecobacter vanneervenii TaxID=48466 RepID=A0A7W8DLP8_9BACT|nr:cytochrome c [Prosthecobacter vanneervenii]MBB5034548.1 mono/diheme cytochrome c family protein [Prosthecobacter vanneervenii]
MSAPAHPDSTDLDRLHSAVKREKEDLAPQNQPAPLWAIFLLMLVAIIAGGQLGPIMNGAGVSFESSNLFVSSGSGDPRPGGAGAGAALDPFALAMKKGASGYSVCGGCHQGNGGGIPGQFPPLAGSEYVLGGTERLVRIVQHGLTGPVTVKGQAFNTPGGMQPFGAAMSSQDLANVLTYIRNTWGNEATMITKEMVQKVRDEEKRTSQWTAADLEPFAKKDIPGDIPAGPGATAAAAK